MEFLETTVADYKEERCRLKDELRHNETQDAVFNPEVLLHRLDVQQMVLVKEEAPGVWMLGVNQQDPDTINIKEEEEELWTSQKGEELCVKKETDDTGFAFTAAPLKSEEDEEKPLFLQLHQHQVKEEDLATSSSVDQIKAATGGEDCGGAETTRKPDLNTYADECSSSETEVSEDDDDDDNVNDSDSQLKDLSDYESEPEDGDKDWKESRAPESGVHSVKKSCSFIEYGKQFHKTSQSVMSSSCLDTKECFEVKKPGGSIKKKYSRQNSFSCEDCGKKFNRKGNLNIHMIVHTGQKPFACDLCGQRFGHKSHLNTHMIVHTGQKAFACDLCGQRFRHKSHLNTHMLVHTGQKAFACDVCGHRFGQKSNLNRHMIVHTGQKPFACDICGQRFTSKSYLNTHMIAHTGQKPFACDLCGQRFGQKPHLNTHMIVHTG
ncbi:zinc finger protein 85-like, partial [Nematolebias whitei]|uniref:zinc finger protein 85-like n=1 Tax=Nematolebias whitei TaxID=451745 RepID=UPI001898AC32